MTDDGEGIGMCAPARPDDQLERQKGEERAMRGRGERGRVRGTQWRRGGGGAGEEEEGD